MNIPYLSLKAVTAQHAEEIQQAVRCVVDNGWYLLGEEVKAFETEYARYVGAKHCVACANGLDALTLIMRAYKEMGKLEDGDEIIVPSNTYIATILAISANNLKPVLVEPRLTVDGETLVMGRGSLEIDEDLIEASITPRTRGVMLVHLYGFNAYTERIGEMCRRHNLLLMHDCAQSHGVRVETGDAWAHSFYPGKNLGALGDAGCVTTNDDRLAQTIRTLANYGSSRKYVFPYKGQNSRMDEIQAAVLRIKLRYLDEDNDRRREIAMRYNREIRNRLVTLPPVTEDAVYHIFPILCSERDRLQQYLKDNGIGTMIHYPIPPHRQEAYREWNALSYPISEKIHREELSLPCNQTMTDEEVTYVIQTINQFT